MRKIGKKRQLDFVKMATEKIIAAGAIPQQPKFPDQKYTEFVLELTNPIKITLYPVGHHEYCFSIFGIYNKAIPNVTGPSGKNNFHEYGPNGLDRMVDNYLKWAIEYGNQI